MSRPLNENMLKKYQTQRLMARRSKYNYSLVVLVIVLLLVGLYCLYMSNESVEQEVLQENSRDSVEYLESPEGEMNADEPYQLIDSDEMENVGIGTGPGLYGSGRDFSDGIGN